jgi:hypothetical protein
VPWCPGQPRLSGHWSAASQLAPEARAQWQLTKNSVQVVSARPLDLVNSVTADMLCSFACERADNWPDFVQLVKFAINDPALPLGSGYTAVYAEQPPPSLPPRLVLQEAQDPAWSDEAVADLMGQRRATI